jgi:hypothetical protein
VHLSDNPHQRTALALPSIFLPTDNVAIAAHWFPQSSGAPQPPPPSLEIFGRSFERRPGFGNLRTVVRRVPGRIPLFSESSAGRLPERLSEKSENEGAWHKNAPK